MPNFYKQFKDLIPGDPLLIGEVIEASTGRATVQFLDGSLLQVRGTALVGQKVYIRGGFIQGEAPSLTVVEITL